MPYSHHKSPGLIPQRRQIYSPLLTQNWCVKTLGEGVTRLCVGGVSSLLQNERTMCVVRAGT